MLRFAVAALCVLGLTAPSAAAETCRGVPMPPVAKRAEPTVPYDQTLVSAKTMAEYCGTELHPSPAGCAYETRKGHFQILVRDTLPLEEFACVVAYEKSHLPPNNWFDPSIETTYQYNPN